MPGSFVLGLVSSLQHTFNSLGSFEDRTDPTSYPRDKESASLGDSYTVVPSLEVKVRLLEMLTARLGWLKCSGILRAGSREKE